MNSIFDYERRGYSAEPKRRRCVGCDALIVSLVLSLVLLMALTVRTIAPAALSAGHSPERPAKLISGQTGDLTTLCAQYRSDHLMTGERMNSQTVAMCDFND